MIKMMVDGNDGRLGRSYLFLAHNGPLVGRRPPEL